MLRTLLASENFLKGSWVWICTLVNITYDGFNESTERGWRKHKYPFEVVVTAYLDSCMFIWLYIVCVSRFVYCFFVPDWTMWRACYKTHGKTHACAPRALFLLQITLYTGILGGVGDVLGSSLIVFYQPFIMFVVQYNKFVGEMFIDLLIQGFYTWFLYLSSVRLVVVDRVCYIVNIHGLNVTFSHLV